MLALELRWWVADADLNPLAETEEIVDVVVMAGSGEGLDLRGGGGVGGGIGGREGGGEGGGAAVVGETGTGVEQQRGCIKIR